MKVFKRIVTQILAFVTCISLCVCTVFADWYNDLAYKYTQSNLSQWCAGAVLDGVGAYLGASIGTVVLPGIGTVTGAVLGEYLGSGLNAGFNDLMNWLAEEPSYVPEDDYVSSLDSPVISMGEGQLFLGDFTPQKVNTIPGGGSYYTFNYPNFEMYKSTGVLLDYGIQKSSVYLTFGPKSSKDYHLYDFNFSIASHPFSVSEYSSYNFSFSSFSGSSFVPESGKFTFAIYSVSLDYCVYSSSLSYSSSSTSLPSFYNFSGNSSSQSFTLSPGIYQCVYVVSFASYNPPYTGFLVTQKGGAAELIRNGCSSPLCYTLSSCHLVFVRI